jgi:hypothetical protein
MSYQPILIYSKYSILCSQFIEMINKYGIPIPIFSIDNSSIREKIIKDSSLSIRSVPCVLFLYQDGKKDKLQGNDAINWITAIVQDRIKEMQMYDQPQEPIEDNLEEEKIPSVKIPSVKTPVKIPRKKPVRREPVEPIEEPIDEPSHEPYEEIKPIKQRIPKKKNITNLEELHDIGGDIDEDSKMIPPRRIKLNEGADYEENEEFFKDEPETFRKGARKSIKEKAKASDVHGTMSKANEMELARKEIEDMFPQKNRPMEVRRI